MFKKFFSLIFIYTMVISILPGKAFSADYKKESYYNISLANSGGFFSTDSNLQMDRQKLRSKFVEPGRALALSALYFGLGQLYTGKTLKGVLILLGGTVLITVIFGVFMPIFKGKNVDVERNTNIIAYLTLGLAYVLNVRDAYNTAIDVNKRIKDKLLLSESIINQIDKFSLKKTNELVKVNYKALSF